MKVKDLIKELSKHDPELDIAMSAEYIQHDSQCGTNDYGCYCMSESHEFFLPEGCVCLEKKYDRKTKQQVPVRVVIRGA